VVTSGLVAALVGTAAYTQVGAETPYAALTGALLLIGAGLGCTIVPAMAAAFATLSREAVPRATSTLNTIQRIAGAVGTAVLAIVLQRAIAAEAPSLDGGIQAMAGLSPEARAQVAPALADAFGTAFGVALALIAAALVPALLLPRRRRGEAVPVPAAEERRAA
jgi:hypothetical protein